jgi:hypothetical protein
MARSKTSQSVNAQLPAPLHERGDFPRKQIEESAMSRFRHSDFTRLLLLACSIFLLASCSDSNDPPAPADAIGDGTDGNSDGGSDDGSGDSSGGDTGDTAGAPQGVMVVSGDGDGSEPQNTISWELDPDATDYTVYWDNAPGVTETSSVVVPAAEGSRYVVHSGAELLAGKDNTIVVVGANGTILTSADAVTWSLQPSLVNNDLNDITWDGNRFVVVGSNDTVLTSPDGLTWTTHIPGTSDINFVAVTQWDSGLPDTPVLGVVGSAGTFVISPANDPGSIIRTGTTEQLGGLTWVDGGDAPGYFVIVGNDGTVMTVQYE